VPPRCHANYDDQLRRPTCQARVAGAVFFLGDKPHANPTSYCRQHLHLVIRAFGAIPIPAVTEKDAA
jgi:hypothetical protein